MSGFPPSSRPSVFLTAKPALTLTGADTGFAIVVLPRHMEDVLPAVVADVALYVTGWIVPLARDERIAAHCEEAAERCAYDEEGEVAHTASLAVLRCSRLVEIDKVVVGRHDGLLNRSRYFSQSAARNGTIATTMPFSSAISNR